jgi:glycosyltransferase involved in cell wall biosynthesis
MKILVINSSEVRNRLPDYLFEILEGRGFSFLFFGCKEKNNNSYPVIFSGPKALSKRKIIFYPFYPFLFIKNLFFVFSLKKKHKIRAIITSTDNDKIIFSRVAKILKLKNVLIETPEEKFKEASNFYKKKYKRIAKYSKIITFLKLTENELRLKILGEDFSGKNLKVINPGISINNFKRQENIFTTIAKGDKPNYARKYFTIGTIINSSEISGVESFFSVVSRIIDVIPNLQIIIVDKYSSSDNLNNKKKINWLAKKMNVSGLVWYVQENKFLNKWFESFDVFLVTSQSVFLDDLNTVISALASGLTVLAPDNKGFEDIIADKKTGFLFEKSNNGALSKKIIDIHKDKNLRKIIGKNAMESVKDNFLIEYTANGLEKVLKE